MSILCIDNACSNWSKTTFSFFHSHGFILTGIMEAEKRFVVKGEKSLDFIINQVCLTVQSIEIPWLLHFFKVLLDYFSFLFFYFAVDLNVKIQWKKQQIFYHHKFSFLNLIYFNCIMDMLFMHCSEVYVGYWSVKRSFVM